MKHTQSALLTICLLASTTLSAQRTSDSDVRSFLGKFRKEYAEAMRANTPDVLARHLADNIRLMPEFQPTVVGKKNVLDYHRAFALRFKITGYDCQETEVIDLNTKVLEQGIFTQRLLLKEKGIERELKGKYARIWRKDEQGNCLLVTEAWNYNQATDIGESLKFSSVEALNVATKSHVVINSNISFELAALNHWMEVVITQHDNKIWSQFFTDDAMFSYSNHSPLQGRTAIDKFLVEHAAQLPIFEKLDIRNDEIEELPGFVIEYASHTAIVRNGDYSGVHTGKDLRIWRREKNGTLKIFRQIAMYD